MPIYISNVSSFSRQSLLMILLFIVSLYSDPSTYDNLGTFLVRLAIVLSLRQAPIGLVYKPAYIFLCPLASSMHQLPSNLVPSLRLPLVSSPHRLFNDYMAKSSSPSLTTASWSPFKRRILLDNSWSSGPVGLHSLSPFKQPKELYMSSHYT